MKIESIKLENWKCFSDQLELEFANIEIFSFPNGSGKTSVLEAIYYGLWGKTDNKMSSYQNHDGQTKVDICFDIDGTKYEIKREFPTTVAELYKDGASLKTGIREIYDYMNAIVPYNLVKRLWFKGDIADAEVLDFNFFKNEILAEQLDCPSRLYKYYSQSVRSDNKQIKDIIVNNSLRDIADVDEDIADIQSKIKSKTSVNNNEYARALQIKSDVDELGKLSDDMARSGVDVLSNDDIYKWNNINLDMVERQLSNEESKISDAVLSSINSGAIRAIYNSNEKTHKCAICGGTWDSKRSQYISDILNKGLKSYDVINDLKSKIDFKRSIDDSIIRKSEEYHRLSQSSSRMPNYEDVINSYDKDNDILWDRMQDLNHERDAIIRNSNNIDLVAKLTKRVDESKKKMEFLKKYMDTATSYYTQALLEKSNDILSGINDEYTGLTISPDDNVIQVNVRGDDLLVSQMSRGERTMVAMSLIYSIRDIFTPSMPLIFDESFASLSENNNHGVILFVKHSQEQLFIISHSRSWTDYTGYDLSTTNVRTSW